MKVAGLMGRQEHAAGEERFVEQEDGQREDEKGAGEFAGEAFE